MNPKRGKRYRNKQRQATCRVTRVRHPTPERRGTVWYTGTDQDDGHSPGLFGGRWKADYQDFCEEWEPIEPEHSREP
jgi:hypothetical protein